MLALPRYEIDGSRLRLPALGLAAGGVVLAHLPTGVGLPCPLRSLTGVPCPFCGLTTAVRALGGGHVAAAVRAAPIVLVMALVCAVAIVRPLPGRLRVPIPVLGLLLAGEWVFELARYHVV